MAGEITDQQFIDAGTDATAMALIVNGDDTQNAIPLRAIPGVAGSGGTARSLRNAAATIAQGNPGDSAYQVWLAAGNVGSQAAFLASLVGPAGAGPDFSTDISVDGSVLIGATTAILTLAVVEGYISAVIDEFGGVYSAINPDSTQFGVVAPTPNIPTVQSIMADASGAEIIFGDEFGGVIMKYDITGQPILSSAQIPQVFAVLNPPDDYETYSPAAFAADINHIMGMGQSLKVAADSGPIISPGVAPYPNNLKFSRGVNASCSLGADTFAPLAEAAPVAPPGGFIAGLSIAIGNGQAQTGVVITGDVTGAQVGGADGLNTSGTTMGAQITAMVASMGLRHDLLVSSCAQSGQPYLAICGPTDWQGALVGGVNQGSPAFREFAAQVANALSLSTAAGKKYMLRMIHLGHGETDTLSGNWTLYYNELATLLSDAQAKYTAITGNTNVLHMGMAQCCLDQAAQQQLQRALATPVTHGISHTQYQLLHQTAAAIAAGADNLHLQNYAQQVAGAYEGKYYRRRIMQNKFFIPPTPLNINIVGNQIIINYWATNAPLVLDTSLVPDPGNYGFVFADGYGTSITNVAVTGPKQITITLSQIPAAASVHRTLSYAMSVTNGSGNGPNSQQQPIYGNRGCVRNTGTERCYYPDGSGIYTMLDDYATQFGPYAI